MEWTDYMAMAAKHSRNSARHWFRYLRKYIHRRGTLFSEQDVECLARNESLTPFQRVSIKAAFEEGSATRQHIISLNQRAMPSKLLQVRRKHETNGGSK